MEWVLQRTGDSLWEGSVSKTLLRNFNNNGIEAGDSKNFSSLIILVYQQSIFVDKLVARKTQKYESDFIIDPINLLLTSHYINVQGIIYYHYEFLVAYNMSLRLMLEKNFLLLE